MSESRIRLYTAPAVSSSSAAASSGKRRDKQTKDLSVFGKAVPTLFPSKIEEKEVVKEVVVVNASERQKVNKRPKTSPDTLPSRTTVPSPVPTPSPVVVTGLPGENKPNFFRPSYKVTKQDSRIVRPSIRNKMKLQNKETPIKNEVFLYFFLFSLSFILYF